jgi:hypothetical protein
MIYYEDVKIGEVQVSGAFELTEVGIVDFAKQWDPRNRGTLYLLAIWDPFEMPPDLTR